MLGASRAALLGAGKLDTPSPFDTTATTSRLYSDDNFTAETTASADFNFVATRAMSEGKWFLEIVDVTASVDHVYGFATSSTAFTGTYAGAPGTDGIGVRMLGNNIFNGFASGFTIDAPAMPSFTLSSGDRVQLLIDIDNKKMFFGANGSFNLQNPGTGVNPAVTWTGSYTWYFHARPFYSGHKVSIQTSPSYSPPVGYRFA